MKKIFILLLLLINFLFVFSQNIDKQVVNKKDYIPVNTYIYSGIFNDTVAHLVWENYSNSEITHVQVERSFDSIKFSSVAFAYVNSLIDIHVANYNPSIIYFNNILLSTERGNIGFIYNDVINNFNLNEINTWYRIIMYDKNGLSYSSPIVKSKTKYNNKSEIKQSEQINYNPFFKSTSKSCPPLGTPPTGYIPCGPPQTQNGQCCTWTEQPYVIVDSIEIVCNGSSYAYCCDNVPEAPGCTASGACFAYAYDPCCVHSCIQYYICQCTPWTCCSSSQLQVMVVTQTTPFNSFSVSGNVQNETCSGLNDGAITISTTATQPIVSYLWSNNANTQNLANIPGGSYSVTATDANGCIGTSSFTVTSSSVNITSSYTDEHCGHSDGTALAVVTGGNGSFTYLWNTTPPQTNSNAINLSAGTYIVTASDGSCTITDTVIINNIPGPSVSISNIIDETCGSGNGSATCAVSGGLTPYTYHWNCNPPQSTQTMSGVHAGTYYITITDANNCTASNSVIISNSPLPSVSVQNIIPANCGYSNGSITVSVSGGTPPYQYQWNTTPTQTTQTASGIPSGSYTITVTDSIGCNKIFSGTVTQLPGPTAVATGTPEICFRGDGSATVTGNGGFDTTYTYTWNTNPIQTSQTATNLSSGTYNVSVSDGGCITVTSVNIGNIPGPTAEFSAHPHVLTIVDGPVTFFDHSMGNIVSWQWTLGDGSTQSSESFNHRYDFIGVYPVTLIVTDDNACLDTISDTIVVKDIFTIYIPSAFSPDDNGKNDYFYPQGINWDPTYFEMYIYDRWGNLMFETKTIGDKWNGTFNNKGSWDDVVLDVYVYLVRVKELEGPKHEYVGRVTLIR